MATKTNKPVVDFNRDLLAKAYKTGKDYGVDIFSKDFRAWDEVADFMNTVPNPYRDEPWTGDAVRLLSYWYTADDSGQLIRRTRAQYGYGPYAVKTLSQKFKRRLQAKDPMFSVLAASVLNLYKNIRSPRRVAALLNVSNVPEVVAYRKQRGQWNDARVYKIITQCRKQRPEIYTAIMGEAVTRKSKKTNQLMFADVQVPQKLTFTLGDTAVETVTTGKTVATVPRLPATVAVRPGGTAWALPRKTTRVSIQHDGDVLQVIRTPQQRLVISAKSTAASGGKFVEAVTKLCAELGVDVSKW